MMRSVMLRWPLRFLALFVVSAFFLTACDNAGVDPSESEGLPGSEEASFMEDPPFEKGLPTLDKGRCTVTTDSPQDAVNAASPGDVVCVEDGVYGPIKISTPGLTVTSLRLGQATIQGGSDPISSAVEILADEVTFTGFGVTFPGGLIGISVGPNVNDVTIRKNWVHDIGPTGRLGVTGIITDGGNTGITVEYNIVENLRNEFTSDAGSPTVNGIFANDDRADGFSDSVIRKNLVGRLFSDNAALGIVLQGTVQDVSVKKNLIFRLSADPDNDSNEADDNQVYDENLDDGYDGSSLRTFAQGVNIDASSTSDLQVTENVIAFIRATSFNGESVKVDSGAEGLAVTFNDLRAEVGLENGTDTPFDATCNYWGHPRGPRVVPNNPAADDGPNRQRRSAVVGDADVRPWLVRSILTGRNLEKSCVGGRGNGNR
jgi:hypothetical protein